MREDWRGYLWQGRFASVVMDERHLMNCARYVEMNPVRAGLVKRPEDWRWSSAAAHLAGRDDGLVEVKPLLERAPVWRELLDSALSQADYEAIRSGRTDRPAAWNGGVRPGSGGSARPRPGPSAPWAQVRAVWDGEV